MDENKEYLKPPPSLASLLTQSFDDPMDWVTTSSSNFRGSRDPEGSQVPFIAPPKKSMVCYTLSGLRFLLNNIKACQNILFTHSFGSSFWGLLDLSKQRCICLYCNFDIFDTHENRADRNPAKSPENVREEGPISGEKGTRRRRSFAPEV